MMKVINIDFENKTFETDNGETFPFPSNIYIKLSLVYNDNIAIRHKDSKHYNLLYVMINNI